MVVRFSPRYLIIKCLCNRTCLVSTLFCFVASAFVFYVSSFMCFSFSRARIWSPPPPPSLSRRTLSRAAWTCTLPTNTNHYTMSVSENVVPNSWF